MSKGDILVAGVVVVFVALLGYVFFFADSAPSGVADLGYAPVDVPGAQMLEAYAASNEAMNVVVDIPVESWVTVHAAIGSAPGPIIGQSGYMESGGRMTSMRIEPLMVTGVTYIVLVHKDDGDGSFDINKDLPIMADGTVLRADVVAPQW
ncbi:MAG: hypothetical protein AAB663_01950 [Patescibacteria group bacterium]